MQVWWLIRARDVVNKKQKPFCLVNVSAVSIHHVAGGPAIWRSAFIFDERRASMVNRFFARRRARPQRQFRL
ncbi:hypothetical protein ACVIW2_006879 [Bradyrhizobium huanghuaihaiense]|uniref:hypothetical protein n=1 Tax=Bradyrhizobium huanghuaihaiense TaxID=990078 RepID=UPI0011A6AEE4|nr:hypothetical protein [Bradyrhizobium huanghuaihaiense]